MTPAYRVLVSRPQAPRITCWEPGALVDEPYRTNNLLWHGVGYGCRRVYRGICRLTFRVVLLVMLSVGMLRLNVALGKAINMITQGNIKPSPKFFYGYVIVAATFIIAALVEGAMYSFGIFFDPLLTEFGWTRAMTSGAFSLFMLFGIPISPIAGKLTDRFGGRTVLTVCGSLLVVGYLLLSRTSTIWQLYLFYGVIVGTGMGFYWVPLLSTVPEWFVKKRGLVMGIVTSGIGIGQLIVPPLADWSISTYGWRTSYILLGATMAIIIAAAQFLRRPKQMGVLAYGAGNKDQEVPVAKVRGFSVREAICTRQFWIVSGLWFCWQFCLAVVLVHSVIYAIGLGMSSAGAAKILSIIGLAGIMGRLAFGRFADVIGVKSIVVAPFILMSLAFSGLIIGGVGIIYLFAVVFGIAYSAVEVLQSPTIAELFGLSSLGAILGATHGIGHIGSVLGAVIAGYIFDVTSSYRMALFICVAMGITGVILSVFLKPTGSISTGMERRLKQYKSC